VRQLFNQCAHTIRSRNEGREGCHCQQCRESVGLILFISHLVKPAQAATAAAAADANAVVPGIKIYLLNLKTSSSSGCVDSGKIKGLPGESVRRKRATALPATADTTRADLISNSNLYSKGGERERAF